VRASLTLLFLLFLLAFRQNLCQLDHLKATRVLSGAYHLTTFPGKAFQEMLKDPWGLFEGWAKQFSGFSLLKHVRTLQA